MNKQRFLFLLLAPYLCIPEGAAEYYGKQNGVTAVLFCLGVLFSFVGLHNWIREERATFPKIKHTPCENAARVIRNALCMIAGMILFVCFFTYLFRNSSEFFCLIRVICKNPITCLPILISALIPVAAVGIGVMPG